MHNTFAGTRQATQTARHAISPELVQAAQKVLACGGDTPQGTVLELIRQCEKKLTPFLLHKMRTRQIARETGLHEDATREVILVLLKSALLVYKVEEGASFDTYLFKIAERVFARLVSRAEPVAKLTADVADSKALVAHLESRHVAENEQLTRVHLQEALDTLAPQERDAVLRYIFGGDTFQEIADSWNMPLSTAYRFIKAVFAKLRRELGEDAVPKKEPQTR